MATLVVDHGKALELIKQYRPLLEIGSGAGGATLYKFLCPFHTESTPSFSYNPSTDNGSCWGCHKKGGILEIMNGLDTSLGLTKKSLKDMGAYVQVARGKETRKVATVDVSSAQIGQWQTELTTAMHLQVLIKKWGWTPDVVQQYQLGCSEGRLVFPMYEGADLVNVKFYTPGASAKKYENKAGSYAGVWPFENLSKHTLYVVEGEKDCLTMLSQGFNAITFTGGARTIAKSYLRYFAGKEVYIIYDIDEAGHQGASALGQALSRITEKTVVVDLPAADLPPKGDITDMYVMDPENFAARVTYYCESSTVFKGQDAISRVPVPSEVYPTYLEDVVKSKRFFKRVSSKVRVVNNARNEVSLVPKNVIMRCNKDYKEAVCSTCPMFFEQDGIPILMKPEYPEIMSIIGNNIKTQKEALRSLCEIAPGCPRFKVEYKEFQALYPIVVIPAIEANKPSHDYQLVGAWAMDIPAKENEDYAVEAVVLANPETHKLEMICYKMEQDKASLDEFELTPEMIKQLECFQCKNHQSQI